MDLDQLILSARFIIHVITAIIVCLHVEEATDRGWWHQIVIGGSAWFLAGTSGAMAFQIINKWDDWIGTQIEPWLLLYTFAVLVIVAMARGDVSKILAFNR